MINLLPPDIKSAYRYGRANVGLRRWVLICLVALIGLGAIATYGSLTLHQDVNHSNDQITSFGTLLQKENFSGTQKQAQDITNNFKLVVKVLGQEILFSKLLQQVGTIMPNNANLTGLNISQTQGALDVTAITDTYKTATQVQVNLADPANQLFTKADIVGIVCNSANASDPDFPCTVTLRALFSANNPFLLINSSTTKAVKP